RPSSTATRATSASPSARRTLRSRGCCGSTRARRRSTPSAPSRPSPSSRPPAPDAPPAVTVDARRLWTLTEPVHALTYFAPEAHAAFTAAGLRGFWRGYFAGRAAPLGHTPAEVVTATFFGFHPAFVARAVPSVWDILDPAAAIDARLAGVDGAMRA